MGETVAEFTTGTAKSPCGLCQRVALGPGHWALGRHRRVDNLAKCPTAMRSCACLRLPAGRQARGSELLVRRFLFSCSPVAWIELSHEYNTYDDARSQEENGKIWEELAAKVRGRCRAVSGGAAWTGSPAWPCGPWRRHDWTLARVRKGWCASQTPLTSCLPIVRCHPS